jgi:hypothetical protein
MKPLIKNYRDVGASLSCCIGSHTGDQDDNSSSQNINVPNNNNNNNLLLIPPGFLLRSSAWDTQAEIRWKDLGRPNTILNLRETHEVSSYRRLMVVDDDSYDNANGKKRSDTMNTNPTHVNVPKIWHISAENDIEKYNLSLSGCRDWLISVLQHLLKDIDDNVEDDIDSSSNHGAFERLHTGQINTSNKEEENDESIVFSTLFGQSNNAFKSSLNTNSDDLFTSFRIALAIVLRRRISKYHAPLLIHCRFGRDRTGIIVVFLLKLLIPSLSDSIILKEFLLSDLTFYNIPSSSSSSHDYYNTTDFGKGSVTAEMSEKGAMLTELTLKNLPSVYEFIESRRKIIFRGTEFKKTRAEIAETMSRLETLHKMTMSSSSLPKNHLLFPPLITTFGFSISEDYIKSEARRYFKNAQLILKPSSSCNNRSGSVNMAMDIDEQHHLIWASFAFHHCAHLWLKTYRNCDGNASCVQHIKRLEDDHDHDVNEIIFKTIGHNLQHLHLNSIATQLAWTMIQQGINVIYPLPSMFDSLENIQKVHTQLQNWVCEVEDIVKNTDSCPSFLVERVRIVKNRIIK